MRTPCTIRARSAHEWWTSDSPQSRLSAASLCVGACPLAAVCRDGALHTQVTTAGVWGGVDFAHGQRAALTQCGAVSTCPGKPVGFARVGAELVVPACRDHADGVFAAVAS